MQKTESKDATRWRRHGLAFQLLKSHLFVASIGLVMLLIALASTYYLHSKVVVLAEEGGPIAQASSKVLAEVQHSLAGVRGWVSLGDKTFLGEWKKAWVEGIEPAMNSLEKHKHALKKAGSQDLINRLPPLLIELKESQWWVNNVAQTPGNEPARVSYLFEVEPVALALESIIVSITQEAKKEGRSALKEEIIQLSNVKHRFFLSRLQLEKIVFQGSLYLEDEFRNNLHMSYAAIKDMASQYLMHSAEQKPLISLFQREAGAFERLADNVIKLRKSDKWNVAQHLMVSETVPIAKRAIEVLEKLSSTADIFMRKESSEASRATKIVITVMTLLVFAMIIIAFSISISRAHALTEPISILSISVQGFAEGRLEKDIPIIRDDEVGELTRSFNFMRASIHNVQEELEEANQFLEKRVEERTTELNLVNENLKHEKERAEKYLAISEAIIVALDPKGIVTLLNRRGCDILGYKKNELIGKNWFETVIPAEQRDTVFDIHDKVVAGDIEPVEYFENEVITKTEERKFVFWHNTLVKNDDGTIVGSLSSGQDFTDKRRAEEKIKASLEEKEVLLREIHHRVKNNMQVIISLLRLQSAKIGERQYADMLKESQDRIKSMALIHERLYQSEDIANIDFGGYAKTLTNNLFVSHGVNPDRIRLTVEIEDISLGLDYAIPCGLIINELVSNSLKYAFPNETEGEIRIALRKISKDDVELSLSDNGVGIPEELDFGAIESLGLDLVKILAEHQLGGQIELNRTQGTRLSIKFTMKTDKKKEIEQ